MLTDHFTRGRVTIPRFLAKQSTSFHESPTKKETSLLTSFAQFLSISSVEQDQVTISQMKKFESMARAAIEHCKVEDLLNDTRFMEISTLSSLINGIISLSYNKVEESTDVNSVSFSESSVFLLEILFRILLRNRDRLKELWPLVVLHLETIISPCSHPILIERASTNILRLLLRLTHKVIGNVI
jgi:hypothetical protein